MPPSQLHLTLVQSAPEPRDIAGNLDRVRDELASRAGDTDLIVFPELFLTGYQTAGLDELAMTVEDPRIASLAAACAESRVALLVGFVEPAREGHFDSYLAIDRDGSIRRPLRKTHLFGDERGTFTPGSTIEPVELCGTSVGVINCFELEFPEVARTLALRGARLLAAGAANMEPYELDHRVAATSRALENRLPMAYANRIGSESGHRFCGSSRIVDADGSTLAALDHADPGTVAATVTPGPRAAGPTAMLQQRRPELYEA